MTSTDVFDDDIVPHTYILHTCDVPHDEAILDICYDMNDGLRDILEFT